MVRSWEKNRCDLVGSAQTESLVSGMFADTRCGLVSRAGHLTDTLASAYIARQSQIYSAASHLSSASLSVFGQSSFSTTSTTGDLTTTSSSAAIRNAAAGIGNRTMSAVLAAAVAGVAGAAAASDGRRDGGKGDEGGGGGAAAAGGSIGGGALNQELSDFLNGLDESEKLCECRDQAVARPTRLTYSPSPVLREANIANKVSKAYLSGRG